MWNPFVVMLLCLAAYLTVGIIVAESENRHPETVFEGDRDYLLCCAIWPVFVFSMAVDVVRDWQWARKKRKE